jgi:hypothetical protein
MNFGTVVFTIGLSGSTSSGNWYHSYYQYPNGYLYGNNGPNNDLQPLYVRPHFQTVHATAWGA